MSLYCKPDKNQEYPIICNVCGKNDYIERPSTLGKSKKDQIVWSFFTGDTFEELTNISIITYFCRICGMAKIIRHDDTKNDPYIYSKLI